jgi:cyclophilin family peptidyl-prolyl cis-trans isomerase/HEAT repeat protein
MNEAQEPPSPVPAPSAARPPAAPAPQGPAALRRASWCGPLLLGLLAACQGPTRPTDPEQLLAAESLLRGAAVDLPTRPELIEIARLEAARSTGNGSLLRSLTDPDPVVRRAAARALGRLPFPRFGEQVTGALCGALADPDPGVRREVAFALGIRGDDQAQGVLTAHANDPEAAVRARVVEAITRLGGARAVDVVLRGMADPSPAVRQEAVAGVARWSRSEPRGEDVDRRLLELLSPRRAAEAAEVPPSEVWLVLYALERRQSPLGAGPFLDHYRSDKPEARLFAVRGLARLDPTGEESGGNARPELTEALERATADVDWRVVVEAALGLGAHGDPRSLPVLVGLSTHPTPHVRRAAVRALGSYESTRGVASALDRGLSDISAAVRAEALIALAKVLPTADALVILQQNRSDPDPILRKGVAEAAGELPPEAALGLLEPLTQDPRSLVSMAALTSLGRLDDDRARARLRAVVAQQPDLVLVQVAAEALGAATGPADLEALGARLAGATGAAVDELWYTALTQARRVGGEAAVELARRGLERRNPFLRAEAARVLEQFNAGATAVVFPEAPPAEIPVPGRTYPLWTTNPIAAVETTRGTLYFELYPGDAPLHVYNFLRLAETGYYDGTLFHRVELDFVIQGGDVRGDGAGGASWRGDSLGHEFSERKFLRGSLGMPRWDDPDSGGAQIFVTHRPTPHLDGRYTLFGQLVQGWEVLDQIEVGDSIRTVRLLQ